MAKKKGFGQGSGSAILDASTAARPIANLPTALKIELLKMLKGESPLARRMNNGGAVMKGRGGKFKGVK